MRARELGFAFAGEPGQYNAITDVSGVLVGAHTVSRGQLQTGLSIVCPVGRSMATVPAGWAAFNGNGEMTGTVWVAESGGLSLPVGITSTHAVGTVHRGIVEWAARNDPTVADRWLLPVVAETWDGHLNDATARAFDTADVGAAIETAASGPVAEGSVGGGTGMTCYGYKGGTGTSSRRIRVGSATYTVAVLVQANFGSRRELCLGGVPLGSRLVADDPSASAGAPEAAGSCIALVATDAPLLPGQCKALARRVPLGLGRTGTFGSHFSGDLALAFSTSGAGALDSAATGAVVGVRQLSFLPWGAIDPAYEAVVQAVEEAVVNALVAGRDTVGRDGHAVPGLPVEEVLRLLGGRAQA
jgi:D-aminopeptidase